MVGGKKSIGYKNPWHTPSSLKHSKSHPASDHISGLVKARWSLEVSIWTTERRDGQGNRSEAQMEITGQMLTNPTFKNRCYWSRSNFWLMAGPGHTSHPPQSFNINSALLANIKVYYVTHIEAIMSQSYIEARFYKKNPKPDTNIRHEIISSTCYLI